MSRDQLRSGVLGIALAVASSSWAAGAPKAESPAVPGFGDFSLTSKKEPIEITSDRLDFDYKSRRTVFRGNVEVIQGDVHLQSDTLTVDYSQVGDKQEIQAVNADGHVTITQGPKKASGMHAAFDQARRTVVLTGNAVLEEGSNQVNGDKIVVHPDESRMEVIGENRRVKVVLFPGQGQVAGGAGDNATAKPGAGPTPPPTPAASRRP
jgi:lipopolysaccharide export system protein LptA